MATSYTSAERERGPREARAWNPKDPTQPPVSVTAESGHKPGFVGTPYGELYFMNVSGTPEEMAAAQGRRMREKAHLGVVPFFARYLERVLANSPIKRAAGVLDWAAHAMVSRKLQKNIPHEFKRMITAFCDAADLDEDYVYRAYLMPEVFLYVLGNYHRMLGTSPTQGLGAAPMFGCTSAIAAPPVGDTVLHGRNFDYFGIDYWERFSSVTFHHPTDALSYVSVSTAGLIGGGITSMNSAGLTLVVHQHFPREFDLKSGVPVGVAGDMAIRSATTIEEAVEILRAHPPVSGWTYVMSEGDTGKAAIFEVAAGGYENLQWLDSSHGVMAYANVYWGKEFVDLEVDYYPEYRRCNFARQARARSCVTGLDDGARPIEVAEILADVTDPETGEERLLGPTIANVSTVASVVFEPAARRIWVAAGTSPASRGWYVPFKLGSDDEPGGPDLSESPFTPFPGWRESPAGKAFEYYRRAAHLSAEGETDERLVVLIEHALALHPEEPYLRVLAGLVSLRLGRGRRAEGALRRAMESIDRRDRRAEVMLYLAWSMDVQGRRPTARHLYKKVRRDPDADDVVRSRARYNSFFRFDEDAASKINIDFIYGGVP